MNRQDARYTVRKIRARYEENAATDMDVLRALDSKVRRPASVFAWCFGTLAALIMGTGMCFAMNAIPAGTYWGITVRENMMLPGILIGVGGMLACALTHPLYKGILKHRQRKYREQILSLSERLTIQ